MAEESNKKNITRDDASGLDRTLRPQTWEEYIGQTKIKENLRILLTAARERGHAAEHVLLYGPPGLGKTTLANLIAKTLGTNMRITSGPAIERVGDLAAGCWRWWHRCAVNGHRPAR